MPPDEVAKAALPLTLRLRAIIGRWTTIIISTKSDSFKTRLGNRFISITVTIRRIAKINIVGRARAENPQITPANPQIAS